MELIKDWLSGSRPYVIGARLYEMYGDNDLLKKMFSAETVTDYKKKRLATELQKIIDDSPTQEQPAGSTGQPVPVPTTKHARAWRKEDNKNDIELSLWEEYRIIHKQMDDLRSQLLLIPNDQERKTAALKILRLDDQLDEIISNRNYYLNHGTLPNQQTVQLHYLTDALLIGTRVENLRRYIRREKNALSKNPQNISAAKRKAEFVDEINHYLKQLNKPLYAD
jgi:hypothetical protein